MTKPNISPSDIGSLAAAVHRYMQTYMRENVNDMIPAKIVDYNVSTNRATVQPIVDMVDTDGRAIRRPPLGDIPVYRMGGGDYAMVINLQPGDFGWLKAVDMDISRTMASSNGDRSSPPTDRTHSFSNGIFFPDCGFGVTPSGGDMQIQSKNGSSYIGMDSSGKPAMLSPDNINISAPNTSFTGGASVSQNLSISGTPSSPTHAMTKGAMEAAISSAVDASKNAMYPVGAIFLSTVATNPATLLGFGTWTLITAGTMLLSAGTGYALNSTGGSKDAVVVSHSHGVNINTGNESVAHNHWLVDSSTGGVSANHTHSIPLSNTAGLSASPITVVRGGIHNAGTINTNTISSDHNHWLNNTATGNQSTNHTHNVNGNTGSAGVSGTDANLPPYLAVNMWKRTA